MHDTKKSKLGNTLKGIKRQQTSGVGPLDGRLGTRKGQRQSSSLVPASLARAEQLCQSCLRGERFTGEKERLLM